ncbi:MAG: argininosuccinate synthase [Candidatus Omnitrophica bacterium]|nr:argininosuccinate synthase [Candidatus Omnitrophota bacterium]MCM8798449.1 argininosuccinate synthase [Candidatus Omnitrophota bacterium]
MKKTVLAYSGGLDTSVALHWLKKKGFSVIAFLADVGQGKDLRKISEKAKLIGADNVYVKDLKKEFIEEYCWRALKAGAIYEGKYFLSTALSRPLIAKYLVEIAKKEKAEFVSHGCTGKGNDQVRFEVSVSLLAPHLKIIAPLRIWELKSRDEEIEYAQKNNIPVEITKKSPYSIDRNLWGISIECGRLEDPWNEPPEDAYQMTKSISDTPKNPLYLEVYFEKGIPEKINGKKFISIDLVEKLNKLGGEYGIGRTDLIENRLVGIKSREIYEAPSPTILYSAHQELESLNLDREVLHFKPTISSKYAELVYYGLWFTPLRSALDSFIDKIQENLTGAVRLKLFRGACIPVGRKSPISLYKKELATYGKESKFDQKLAEGFIKIWAMPYRYQKSNSK